MNFKVCQKSAQKPVTTLATVNLMLAQAQEALFEKRLLGGLAEAGVLKLVEISGEAAKVSEKYRLVESVMASETQYAKFLPSSWTSMVQIKTNHYRALSHYFVALSFAHKVKFESYLSDFLIKRIL